MKEKQIFFKVGKLNIYTRIIGESTKAIVFIHGSSGSSEMWQEQLADSRLSERYQLIALDLPGQGQSSRSEDPQHDYSIPGMAKIVSELIDNLNLESFIIVGASLGTKLIAQSILHYNNCIGAMLVSPVITNEDILPSSVLIPSSYIRVFATALPTEEEVTGFLNTVTSHINFHENFRHIFKSSDPIHRSIVGQSLATHALTTDISNLNEANLPVCIITGTNDKIVKHDYLDNVKLKKWNDSVIKLSDAGHLVNSEKPDAFNIVLLDFANEIFNK